MLTVKSLAYLILSIVTSCFFIPTIANAESDSFITENEVFIAIENPSREAEMWATCSSSLEVFSMIIAEERPAQAKQLHQLSNGGSIAIAMSIVADRLGDDMNAKEFPNVWKFAQIQIESLRDTQSTMILSELEMMTENSQQEQFMAKLLKTIEICSSNAETQQMYVDMWRELVKSGIVK